MEQKQTDMVIKTLIEKQTTISTMEELYFRSDRIHDHRYGRCISHLSRRLCDLLQ